MTTGGAGTAGQPRRPRRDAQRPGASARERRDQARQPYPGDQQGRDRHPHDRSPRERHPYDAYQRDRRADPRRNRQARGGRGPRERVGPPPGAVPPRGAAPRAPRLNRPVRSRTPLLVAVGVVAVLSLCGATGWVLLGSSLFDARSVEVLGTKDLPADEVRAAAAVPLGTPMVRLDTDAVAARVAKLRRVAAVEVSRTLSGTVVLEVTERAPVVVVSAPDGVHLVDVTGTDYATVAPPPPRLPQLRVAHIAPGDPSTMAALTVLTGLPSPLRAQVLSVRADSPADVVLELPDDRQVRWGGVEQGDRKAAVLGPLLTRDGDVYDVSSPDLPTVS